jgi:hypothetical protein
VLALLSVLLSLPFLFSHMVKLTEEEKALLRDLVNRGGEAAIEGSRSRSGLDRLVKENYVTSQSTNIQTVIYTITDAGRKALAGT